MSKLTEEEKLIRDTSFISEVPAKATAEIVCNGKVLVRRIGSGEIERIEE